MKYYITCNGIPESGAVSLDTVGVASDFHVAVAQRNLVY